MCCSPWGRKELYTTERLSNKNNMQPPSLCSSKILVSLQNKPPRSLNSCHLFTTPSHGIHGKSAFSLYRFTSSVYFIYKWKYIICDLPWRRKWQPIPVYLPGKSHGQRSLEGNSPWGCKKAGHDLATKQGIYIPVNENKIL